MNITPYSPPPPQKKNVKPILEAKIFTITNNCLIWILVQTVFFVHAKFEHDTITERAKK